MDKPGGDVARPGWIEWELVLKDSRYRGITFIREIQYKVKYFINMYRSRIGYMEKVHAPGWRNVHCYQINL